MSASRLLFTYFLLSTALLPACDDEPADPPSERVRERARERARSLATVRELATAKADRGVAERLAAGRWLRVDAAVPPDTDQSRHVLLAGELTEVPATYEALKQDHGERVEQEIMLGGEDATRPVVFRDVVEGTHTACVAVSGPASAEDRALLERAAALFEADGPQPLNAEKLQAALAAAQAETGHKPKRTDWDPRPLRCRRVDVDARPESRIAAFEPA
ncbi:hypothetical protein SAMN02745121_04795 [Nannocystis exedens]|uniref:Uncharacterized protein n=1 Tax=Nannocystis exedens TaxID=54 RepID=A0A1I2BUV0_9BACT|nr:hypothetical protein [Nannocystis exedens]PCC71243.1 hypothetical protein NAEX_04317 [Nannocystis exedens]SFE59851.1 hypothetical protein SAMN02745121_04795 [Nannocystis exedens]